MFNPQEKYLITTEEIKVLKFDKYAENHLKTRAKSKVLGEVKDRYIEREMGKSLKIPCTLERVGLIL